MFRQTSYISLAGFINHSLHYLASPRESKRYPNPAYKDPQTGDVDFDQHFAIYCLHGIADRPSAYNWIAQYLIDKLPNFVTSINIIALDNTMTTFAEDVEQVLRTIKANRDRHIILIGHSKGSIDAAHLAELMAAQQGIKVHGVLMITSPLEGSPYAIPPLTWISPPVRQMTIGAPELAGLREIMLRSAQKYFYYVAGKDSLLPPGTCYLPNYTRRHFYEHDGHASIMSSPQLGVDIARDLDEVIWTEIKKAYPQLTANAGRHMPVDNDFTKAVLDACASLDAEIVNVRNRPHLKHAIDKIIVLKKLGFLLRELCDHENPSPYPDTTTLRDFTLAYLFDKNAIYPGSNITPLQILRDSLNYVYLFSGQPRTVTFIIDFLRQYGGTILLPRLLASHSGTIQATGIQQGA